MVALFLCDAPLSVWPSCLDFLFVKTNLMSSGKGISETLIAPELDALDETSWRKFFPLWRAYVKRGGKVPLALMLVDSIIPLYSGLTGMEIEPKTKCDDLAKAIWKLYAPKDKASALKAFRSLKLTTKSVTGILAHCQAFSALRQECDGVMPPESMLVDVFLQSLSSRSFRDSIEVEEPKDLKTALVLAAKLAKDYFSISPTTTDEIKSTPICHHCQKPGHLRPDCPSLKNGEPAISRPPRVKKVDHVPSVVPHVDMEVVRTQQVVAALLDTGAEISLVKPAVAHELIKHGAPVHHVQDCFETVDGSRVAISQIVEVELKVRRLATPAMSVKVQCAVAECGEDVIIGWKDLRESRLMTLFRNPLPPASSPSSVSSARTVDASKLFYDHG